MVEEIKKHIDMAPEKFAGAVTPVFKLKDDSTPYHAGTMFAVKVDDEVYFITASHVLKKNENYSEDEDDQIFAIADGTLSQIESFDKYNVFDSKSAQLDVVAIKPKLICWSSVFECYISEADVYSGALSSNDYICAYGFPESKNKIRWKTDILSNVPYGYFGRNLSPDIIKSQGYGNEYIGVDISLKKVFADGQKEIKPPKPQGISGGPIYRTHNFSKPSELIEPMLVGVTFEKMVTNNGILGISFSGILNGLKNAHNKQFKSDS